MKTKTIASLALALALVATGVASAQSPNAVKITTRDGREISGKLVGFVERRYVVYVGDALVELKESEIRRIEFEEPSTVTILPEKPPKGPRRVFFGGESSPSPSSEPRIFFPGDEPRSYIPGEEPAPSPSPIAIESLIPPPAELPASITRVETRLYGGAELRERYGNAKANRLFEFVDVLLGAREAGVVTWHERRELRLVVFRYQSAKDARDAEPALRRRALYDRGDRSTRTRWEDFDLPLENALLVARAGPVIAALCDDGAMTLTSEPWKKAVLARLERIAPDDAHVDPLPAMLGAFGIDNLDVPAAFFPEPITSLEPIDEPKKAGIAPIATFTQALVEARRYRAPSGFVELRYYHGSMIRWGAANEGPLAEPTAEELAMHRAIWRAPTKAVGIVASGSIPEKTVAWFEQFVESEMKRAVDTRDAKRIEGAAARGPFVIEDLLPRPADLPVCFTFVSQDVHNADTLRMMAFDRTKTSGGESVWLIALRSKLERLGEVRFEERAALSASIFIYETEEIAEWSRAFMRRVALSSPSDALHQFMANARELGRAGRIVVVLRDDGASEPGYAIFKKATLARFEPVAGKATLEELPRRREQFMDVAGSTNRLFAPVGLIPSAFESARVIKSHGFVPKGTIFEGCAMSSDAPLRFVYASKTGSVELAAYVVGWASDPKPDRVPPYRAIWVFHGCDGAVSLKVTGDVTEADVAWFEQLVEGELKRCADSRDARRIDAPSAPRAELEGPRVGERYVWMVREHEGLGFTRYRKMLEVVAVLPDRVKLRTISMVPMDKHVRDARVPEGVDEVPLAPAGDVQEASAPIETLDVSGVKIECRVVGDEHDVRTWVATKRSFPRVVKVVDAKGEVVSELLEIHAPVK